ncbi:MAG: general stress protein [Ignavibacteriae bacterium]|nr:MAG: general stress protein [Ignavibacteriota bacterium]
MHYSHNQENYDKLWDKIKNIRVTMMTTLDEENCLRSRPMYTQQTEFSGDIWFFSKEHSAKIHDVKKDKHVNLSYVNAEDNTYVSVTGNAEIVYDRQKIDEFWDPSLKIWFPEGKDDPELCLIRVIADQAEYWDTKSGTMIYLIGKAMSNLTGEEYVTAENEKLNFSNKQ